MQHAYTFRDLVAHSGATAAQVKNWVQKGVVRPDLGDTSGTGEHRSFSFRDVFETAVAHRLNQMPGGIPSRELTLALDAIRAELPSSPEEISRRGALAREQLESLSPSDAGDAWLLGFCLSLGPGADYQPWRDFVDPKKRDPRAKFWLVWSPRLGFGILVDNEKTLSAVHADVDVVVAVNLGNVLLDLEKKTADCWPQMDEGHVENPGLLEMGLPERAAS